MKFSIIITTHNSKKNLPKALNSIKKQSYSDYDIIVIDANSSDGTIDVLKEHEKVFRQKLSWISEKDNGIYDAMNKGVSMAKGDWLYFLGSDDRLYNQDVLKAISAEIKKTPSDIIYGNVIWGKSKRIYDGEFSSLKLIKRNICHQAIFYNRRIFNKYGKFDTKYMVAADYVLNMKWFNDKSTSRQYINQVIAYYDNKGFSATAYDSNYRNERNKLINRYFPWYIVGLRKLYTPLHKYFKKS